MSWASEPLHLSHALTEFVARRGLAAVRGDGQLRSIWKEACGEKVASQTKVLGFRGNILQIGVANAALLSELASFHKVSLLKQLRQQNSDLTIRDLKFRLQGSLAESGVTGQTVRRSASHDENQEPTE